MGTILVVDDEPPILHVLVETLRDEGHTVLHAVDGVAAQDLLIRHAPALIVSDVMMPRLDGVGLVRWMRTQPHLRDVPVIFVSAMLADPSLDELNPATFIGKPFDLAELLAAVDNALGDSTSTPHGE